MIRPRKRATPYKKQNSNAFKLPIFTSLET